MSFIGSMFNSSQGSGYQAGQANVLNPSNVDEANAMYGQANLGLQEQQQQLGQLQAQNGIGNQSSVFNQQQALANQLQQETQGGGPNPAMAQLAQTTGQNVANQAALMAGQRGTGANAGLIARQAAQQGAATQQNAVGQAATMRANQQLAAQQQLQAQQQGMAGLATNQVGQQMGALTSFNQAAQGEQQNILNSIAQQNNANVGMQSNVNQANSSIAGINAKGQADILGGASSGAATAMMAAYGGEVPNYDDGGSVSGPTSFVGKFMKGFGSKMPGGPQIGQNGQPSSPGSGGYNIGSALGTAIGTGLKAGYNAINPMASQNANIGSESASALQGSEPMSDPTTGMARGGKVPAMVSPGERFLKPEQAKKVAKGEADPMKIGQKIPGKAKVKGDDYKNDTVHRKLEEGGIVIPRHITQSKDAGNKAKKFVEAILAKQQMKRAT